MTDDSDYNELAHSILKAQRASMMLGVELTAFSKGRASLSLTMRDELRQQHGFIHGGIVAYLADCALSFAGGSVLGDSITVEFKLNYLRPAAGEGRLIAIGEVLGHGKTMATVRADVYIERADGSRELCAASQGTIRRAAST